MSKLVARLKVRGPSGVQIGIFPSAGRRTRSMRSPQRCDCASALTPACPAMLDHFQKGR